MNTQTTHRVQAFSTNVKKLGYWTDARQLEVRARHGYAVLDLRAVPEGDIEIHVDMQRSALKLLVPAGAVIDQWDLSIVGRGKVKDWEPPHGQDGRTIKLVGQIRHGEVRVARGGIAVLTAMFSRQFVEDCRRAHREGVTPTLHDPAREYSHR